MRINCAIVDDEPTARDILEIHLRQIDSVHLAGKCKNAIELLNLTAKDKIDLVFLDINMPDVSGINLAKSLDKDIKVIFTTAYREYAVEGFDLQAVDYLLKPVSPQRIQQAVNKYIRENRSSLNSGLVESAFLDIISDRKTMRISCDEIVFIESLNDQVYIHTEEKVIKSRMSISAIWNGLDGTQFIRTHRAFILNKHHVRSYNKESISVGIREIPLSRKYKKQVLRDLTDG